MSAALAQADQIAVQVELPTGGLQLPIGDPAVGRAFRREEHADPQAEGDALADGLAGLQLQAGRRLDAGRVQGLFGEGPGLGADLALQQGFGRQRRDRHGLVGAEGVGQRQGDPQLVLVQRVIGEHAVARRVAGDGGVDLGLGQPADHVAGVAHPHLDRDLGIALAEAVDDPGGVGRRIRA